MPKEYASMDPQKRAEVGQGAFDLQSEKIPRRVVGKNIACIESARFGEANVHGAGPDQGVAASTMSLGAGCAASLAGGG